MRHSRSLTSAAVFHSFAGNFVAGLWRPRIRHNDIMASLSRPMFTDRTSPTESKSRFIEAAVVFTITFGLFFMFGYHEEFAYAIRPVPLTRQILLPLVIALFPSALLLGTLYVTSFYQSRFV